jgi:UDP-3-O-[3-hydroxymyristoyl] glucosamine N-acyltransferase
MLTISVAELAAMVGGEALGDPALRCHRIGPLATADNATVSFLSHPRYRAQLEASTAGCVLVSPELRDAVAARPAAVLVADPYLAFARLTQWWAARTRPPVEPGVHRSAVVEARWPTSAPAR